MKKIKLGYKKEPQRDVACCECRKIKLDDIAGLEKEAQDRISYDGRNIDPERSHLNLFVHGTDENGDIIIDKNKFRTPLKERILNRIEYYGAKIRTDKTNYYEGKEVSPRKEKGKNTKESVVAEGIIFQMSHELAMKLLKKDNMLDKDGKIDKQKSLAKNSLTYRYFEDTCKFAIEKWGKGRFVGAYIHFDEYTPHMHFFLVPLMSKKKKYNKKPVLDKDGNPIKINTLNAKVLFSRENVKQLWKEYAKAMAPYGARAATGLIPKGAYEERASMDAVRSAASEMEREMVEMEHKKEELEKTISRLQETEALLVQVYHSFLQTIQSIFNKVLGKEKGKVLSFDTHSEKRMATDPYGNQTEYTSRWYDVDYVDLTAAVKKRITAKHDDYYQRTEKDPENLLKKSISKMLLGYGDIAEVVSKANKGITIKQ